MRFHDKYIKIRINTIDKTKKDANRTSYAFQAFLINISENLKPTFVNIDNRQIPTSRNQYAQKYYMEISMELDLLAEDTTEMMLNYSSITAINKHMIGSIDRTMEVPGILAKDAFEKTILGNRFEIEFNGFLYSGRYEGYMTQFDAKPDLEKGYWYGRASEKQLYPKAYKVSLKFESTDFILNDPRGKYPWRKSASASKGPAVDGREKAAASAGDTSYANRLDNNIKKALGLSSLLELTPSPTSTRVIEEYNLIIADRSATKERYFLFYENYKWAFKEEAKDLIEYIKTMERK